MTDQAAPTTEETTALDEIKSRIERLEQALTGPGAEGAPDRLLQANIEATIKQLNDLRAQVDQIAKHLANSAGYRLRDSFECVKCHSRGHAAVRVSCTVCNRESWLGWFPKNG